MVGASPSTVPAKQSITRERFISDSITRSPRAAASRQGPGTAGAQAHGHDSKLAAMTLDETAPLKDDVEANKTANDAKWAIGPSHVALGVGALVIVALLGSGLAGPAGGVVAPASPGGEIKLLGGGDSSCIETGKERDDCKADTDPCLSHCKPGQCNGQWACKECEDNWELLSPYGAPGSSCVKRCDDGFAYSKAYGGDVPKGYSSLPKGYCYPLDCPDGNKLPMCPDGFAPLLAEEGDLGISFLKKCIPKPPCDDCKATCMTCDFHCPSQNTFCDSEDVINALAQGASGSFTAHYQCDPQH